MSAILGKIKNKINSNIFQIIFVFSFIIGFLLLSLTFFRLVPNIESKLIDEKKHFLHHITSVVKQAVESDINSESFTKDIAAYVWKFNYWNDKKDYFFLIDEYDRIIAHSNTNLIWIDVKTLVDKNGFELWKEIVNLAHSEGEGYIWYFWPSNKNPSITVSKLSYVTIMNNGKWVLWTWIYTDDVEDELTNITWSIIKYTFIDIWVIILILIWVLNLWKKIESDRDRIQKEFSSVIHNLPIWVFRIDITNERRLIMWNESLLNILWVKEDKLSLPSMCLANFFKNEKDIINFDTLMKNKSPIKSKEVEIINERWETLWINIRGIVVKEWEKIFFDWSIEDITDKHNINKLLEKSYTQLKKTDEMKNEIIWITSHELRTPLTIIKWFASILKNENLGTLTPAQNEYVDKITTSTEKLLTMINNMLDLTKLEAGKMEFMNEEINIWNLIKQVSDDFQVHAEKEWKKINLHIPDNDIIVEYDSLQLKRVFINLIWNAVKFIQPEIGVVDIYITKIKDDTIEIKVKDNGRWIPEENIHDIFSKFKQIGWHMKRTTEWTWLWLSIVKAILEQMWTTIDVHSTLWEGSEFFFTLKIKNNI